jgi:hypothetical protein
MDVVQLWLAGQPDQHRILSKGSGIGFIHESQMSLGPARILARPCSEECAAHHWFNPSHEPDAKIIILKHDVDGVFRPSEDRGERSQRRGKKILKFFGVFPKGEIPIKHQEFVLVTLV